MNKLLLLGALGILSVSATAQTSSKFQVAPVKAQTNAALKVKQSFSPNFQTATPGTNPSAKGTAVPAARWYNHPEALANYSFIPDIYDQTLFGINTMWQDSSLFYPSTTNPSGMSDFGIQFQSIAQVFHPQAITYTDANVPQNMGLQQIGAGDAYTVDSVRVLGLYERTAGSTSVDTLVFTMVTETAARDFAVSGFNSPTMITNHNTDSFAVLLWDAADYQTQPINQISYSIGGVGLSSATVYKMPLTAATLNDTLSNGLIELVAPMAVNVPAGRKASVSITFVSGAPYTPGTLVTGYNRFLFGSHETVAGGYVFYPAGDMNMSYVATSDTSGWTANSTLNYYIPALAFTAPFGAEAHSISFLASCATCSPVSVKNTNAVVEEIVARPNPANNELFVPVTLKTNASNVAVTLTNPMGQVVAKQNLGQVAAGQTVTATFNTGALASGVYFYTVETAGQRITNRVAVAH